MATLYRKNSKVQWSWLGRKVHGVVEESFKASVTKSIKNKKITRHGSEDNPAYLVKSEAGNFALKLHSELEKVTASSASKAPSAKSSPRMFRER